MRHLYKIVLSLSFLAIGSGPASAQPKVCWDSYEPCTEDWECNNCVGEYSGAQREVTCKEVNNVCPGWGGTYINPSCADRPFESSCWDVPSGFPISVTLCINPDASDYGLTCDGMTPGVCGTEIACVDVVRRLPGFCSGGAFDGERCAFDGDCNVCEGSPDEISCYGHNLCAGFTPNTCQDVAFCDLPGLFLPVEMAEFKAVIERASAVLVWKTASETNNAGFSIEHSAFARESWSTWTEAGFVDGSGTTQDERRYEFRIDGLPIGQHRFRLRQIDFDGAAEYSEIVEASVEVPTEFLLNAAYPNPFNPSTTVSFAVAREQTVTLSLFDASGRFVETLYSGVASAQELQQVTVDGSGLASGTYMIRLEGAGFFETTDILLVK